MDRKTRRLLRRWLERRRWNPSLHPRGPDGRFTKSFARPANAKQRKRINYVRNGPKPKLVRTPAESTQLLSRVAPPPERRGPFDIALAQLRAANQSLRAGRPAPNNAISDAMRPLPEPVQAFRSVPRSEFGNVAPEDLRGFVVRDAGFFPASTAPTAPQPGEVRMEINVPAGTRVAASPDTHELVIDAGTEMSVDDIRANPDGSTVMTLTALPPEGADTPDGRGSAPDSPADADTGPGDQPGSGGADSGGSDFERRYSAALSGQAALDSAPLSRDREDEDGEDAGGFTPEESMATFHYFNAGFIETNRQLRAGEFNPNTNVEMWVGQLDGALARSPLPNDVQAWRGLASARRLFGDRLDGDLTGMEWRENGYASTSTMRSVSEEFATSGPEDQVLMRVLVPAGVGAIEVSGEDFEAELMLQRGLTMRVVADNGVDENGIRQLDVEVVPIDAAAAEEG